MGICNVTPDSFSDGGRFLDPADARARVDALLEAGVDIVDIGGESTRPGSKPVPAEVQLERILPAIEHAAARGACISVDTCEPRVAAAALDAGAHVVNDVSLLRNDELASVVAGSGAALVLSHARDPQEKMSGYGGVPLGTYGDVVRDVLRDWEIAAARAQAKGVARDALVMDPGLGFSKASRHSFELLRRIGVIVDALDVPVLVGASRKSFLTLVDAGQGKRSDSPADRDGASLVAALHAIQHGVRIVRVHDVRATRQAIDTLTVLGSSRRKV